MGSALTVFSLYRNNETGYFVLLQTVQPEFSNHSQPQADFAHEIEKSKRDALLNHVAILLDAHKTAFELIGELQALPIGEALLDAADGVVETVFYMNTKFGHPWIILGSASSETAFLEELRDDEDLLGLEPVGQPVMVEAKCFAEIDAVF